MSSGICWQRAHSDQGFNCLLTESLDTINCIYGEQMPILGLRGMNLNLCILRILEDTFSLSEVQWIIGSVSLL